MDKKQVLDVKPEKHNIPVLHHIILSFNPHKSLFLRGRVRAAVQKILIIHNLGLDKAALEIRVDLSGSLGRLGADLDGPGACLLLPGRQVADESENAVAGGDELFQAGFLKAQLFQKHLLFILVKLCDFLLDLGTDDEDLAAVCRGELLNLADIGIVCPVVGQIRLAYVGSKNHRLPGQKI